VRPTGAPNWNTARVDAPGSLDLCFIAADPLEAVIEHLGRCGVTITKGPVEQYGAIGLLRSVYVRDPDGNLVEVAVCTSGASRAAP
jgi:catechol 2,3-dioxygenase-like lactoylglutathione lyase family enzyme